MSDDSFIREVDEELRTERVQNFWAQYGKWIIAVAVAVVVLTGSYRFYQYYSASQAASAGDAFMNAVQLSETDKPDEALAAFTKLENEAGGAYRAMSRFRAAAIMVEKGEAAKAVEAYDAIAADGTTDENLRSIARIRAGMLLVDTGTTSDVEARVAQLVGPTAPFRFSAHEALGLAYFKAGDLEKSFKQFETAMDDVAIPPALRQRMSIMLDLIASNGGPVRK